MADYVYHNDSLPLGGSFYHSPAAGWFYVVVTDSESPGPRQPVSNWMPRSGLVTYGVLLTISAAIVNILLCLINLRRHRRDNDGTSTRFDDTGSSSITMTSSSSFRRPAIINFVVVQLAIGIVVVPVKVMTDTMGVWTIGGTACRAYLLGQVLLIAETMWSVVLLVFDALIQSFTSLEVDSSTSPRYSEFSRRRPRWIAPGAVLVSWLAASTSLFPLGVALTTSEDTSDVVLEEVCAVSMKRDDAVAQAITAFLLPAAVALGGCVAVVCRKFQQSSALRAHEKYINEVDIGNYWVSPVALAVSCCIMWSPFFALYAALPFCPYDRMCVDPGAWTVLAWFGYATSVVGPVSWVISNRQSRLLCVAGFKRMTSLMWSRQRGRQWQPTTCRNDEEESVPSTTSDDCRQSQLLPKTHSTKLIAGRISIDSSNYLVDSV